MEKLTGNLLQAALREEYTTQQRAAGKGENYHSHVMGSGCKHAMELIRRMQNYQNVKEVKKACSWKQSAIDSLDLATAPPLPGLGVSTHYSTDKTPAVFFSKQADLFAVEGEPVFLKTQADLPSNMAWLYRAGEAARI